MADFHARIIPLKTEAAGRIPNDSTMQGLGLDPIHVGELAVNLEDGLIYSKKSDGTIVTLGGNSGGGSLGGGDELWPQVDQLVSFDGLESESAIIPVRGRNPGTGFTAVSGSVHIETVTNGALSRWGTSSMHTVGGGNRMYGDCDDLGTDDFTWEFWVWIDINASAGGTGSQQNLIWGNGRPKGYDTGYTTIAVYRGPGADNRTCEFVISKEGVEVDSMLTGDVLLDQQWNYIAVTRQGGWFRWYVNGIRRYQIDLSAQALSFDRGRWEYGGYVWGYYNDFRFTRGAARYTSADHELPGRPHPPSTIVPIYLDDLVDVQVTGTATERTLNIDYLDFLPLLSDNVLTGERWGLYANSAYGVVVGRYDAADETDQRSQARTFYHPTKGIGHSTDTGHHWLQGDFATPAVNRPELRWTPGNFHTSSSWFGIKLSDNWNSTGQQFTWTLPDAPPTSTLAIMATDSNGIGFWHPLDIDAVELLILNWDSTSEDRPVVSSGGMTTTYPSLDAKFGDGGATFVRLQKDFLSGGWTEALGAQLWTFEFWMRTTDSDVSTQTGKRIIAPQSGTNLADGFQVTRDPAGGDTWTPHTDNAPGALMLNPESSKASYLCSTRAALTADGDWHHYVFQHEGEGNYACYMDGQLMERRARTGGPVDFKMNGGFFIGKRQDNNANAYFDGSLDAMRLTKNVLVYSPADTIPVPTVPPAPPDTVQIYLDELADVDTSTVPPTDGEVLTFNSSTQVWEPAPVQGASGTGPVVKTLTTIGLLPGSYELMTVTEAGRAGVLRELVNSTASDAWVVIYCSEAARAADIASGRTEIEDPAVGAGVLAEFVLTASDSRVICTPPPVTFNAQAETVPELYLRIVNNSNEAASITVQLHLSRTEP